MNKRKMINQKINELQKQLKDLELTEQQKVGAYFLGLYDKGELSESQNNAVAKLIGDATTSKSASSSQTETNHN